MHHDTDHGEHAAPAHAAAPGGHVGAHDHGEAFPRLEVAELVAGEEASRDRRTGLVVALFGAAAALFALALPTEGVDGEVVGYVAAVAERTDRFWPAWEALAARRFAWLTGLAPERAAFLLSALAFGLCAWPLHRAGQHLGLRFATLGLGVGVVLTSLGAWLAATRPHPAGPGLFVSAVLLALLASPPRRREWTALLASAVWLIGALTVYAPIGWLFPALALAVWRRAPIAGSRWVRLVPFLALAVYAYLVWPVFVEHALLPYEPNARLMPLEDPGALSRGLQALTTLGKSRPLPSYPALLGLGDPTLALLAPLGCVVLWLALFLRRDGELEAGTPRWLLAWLLVPSLAGWLTSGFDVDHWTVVLALAIPGAAALRGARGTRPARILLATLVGVQVLVLGALLVHGRVERSTWLTSVEALLEPGDVVITEDARVQHLMMRRYGLGSVVPGEIREREWLDRMERAGRRVFLDGRRELATGPPESWFAPWIDAGRLHLLPQRDD